MIVDITTRILQDLADPQTINNMSDEAWREPLWSALEEAGLTLAWVPEEMGGAGIPVAEGFDVLQVAGAFALPVPLAETLLAGWLLAKAGIQPPVGAMTVAPIQIRDHFALSDDGTVSGRARGVPFARDVAHIAVLVAGDAGAQVALIETAQGMITEGQNLAGESKDTLVLDSVAPIALAALPGGIDQDLLMLMGAAARSMQMAGALQALLDISVQYSGERVAFERPSSAGAIRGRIVRIFRPTRLTAAQFRMTVTRQYGSRSVISACSVFSDNMPSPVSIETVTFVSEVDTRSTDTPWFLKHANTSARNPTSCHMSTPPMDTRVSPLREAIPFT